MNELIRDRNIEKKYYAIIGKRPDPLSGKLTHFLVKDKEKNKVKAFDALSNRSEGAKKAELSYNMIGGLGDHYLLEIDLKTGRPHQIRVQLAKVGYPIRGDLKYGFKTPNHDASIHLHCRSMSFLHPIKKEPITITADPPDEQVWRLFEDMWL
jgi:23S rRNA pseudouridine1911/1915/1917 synthase